jgi:hypothetical protein
MNNNLLFNFSERACLISDAFFPFYIQSIPKIEQSTDDSLEEAHEESEKLKNAQKKPLRIAAAWSSASTHHL